MKITKRQLKEIIQEYSLGMSDDPHGNDAEYERGYQDGLDGYPRSQSATADYDAGYEDGVGDSDIDNPENY